MRFFSFRQIVFITILGALLVPCLAFGQQAYDIETGTNGSFQYSVIHDAASTAGMSPYYPSGDLLFDIDGYLNFSLSGDVLTVYSSTLTATGISGTAYAGEVWTLAVSGGTLDQSVPLDDGINSFMGSLAYSFMNNGSDIGGANSITDHSGSFYFYNESEFGAPNAFDSSSIYLWANNWDNQNESRPYSNAIGIDLGSTTVVPEPISSTLFVIGAALFGFRRYRLIRINA